MEWLYILLIGFWIWNSYKKAKKKMLAGQSAQSQDKRETQRVSSRSQFEEVLASLHTPEQYASKNIVIEEDSDDHFRYQSEDFQFEEDDQEFAAERPTESHFRSGHGLHSNVHDFSKFGSLPEKRTIGFSFAQEMVKHPYLKDLTAEHLRKYLVFSEILGKPKALQRRRP